MLDRRPLDELEPQNTRINRLPRVVRPLGLLLKNILALTPSRRAARRPTYVYEADGLATVHFSPFLFDKGYADLYAEMAAEWFVGIRADVRWRMWLLTSLARECSTLPGNFAEFGVYRAGCAFMILSTSALAPSKRMFLFDTFTGIPDEALTKAEIETGLAGALADTSVDYVAQRLSKWKSQITLVDGDVFETLSDIDTGPIAFVHMDLNAAAPTLRALEYVYNRLVPGAIIVFDDYGETGLEAQRAVVDEFFTAKREAVVALPTRQGLLIRR